MRQTQAKPVYYKCHLSGEDCKMRFTDFITSKLEAKASGSLCTTCSQNRKKKQKAKNKLGAVARGRFRQGREWKMIRKRKEGAASASVSDPSVINQSGRSNAQLEHQQRKRRPIKKQKKKNAD